MRLLFPASKPGRPISGVETDATTFSGVETDVATFSGVETGATNFPASTPVRPVFRR
jgi:hypothetical protein